MILRKRVKVKWAGSTRNHYEKLGYKYTKKDDVFFVWAHQLTPGSNVEVEFKCDYCGSIESKRNDVLRKAREVIEKDCCKRCAPIKHREVLIKKYGSLESKYPEITKEWCYRSNEIKPSEVTPYSKIKVVWVCSEGHKWVAAIYSRTGTNTGCPLCSISKGEKKVANALDSLNIKYKKEVSISDLVGVGGRPLRFDFALIDNKENIKAFIEYDGPFHFSEIYEGSNHERTLLHDDMKNTYCIKNKIPLYRIPYTSYEEVPEIVKTICEEAIGDFDF